METGTVRKSRYGALLVVASASVTVAVAITAGALTGYIHPPPSTATLAAEAAVAAPSPRTVLVPVRPDGAAMAPIDETGAPPLLSVRTESRRGHRERDDGDHRRREEHDDDD